FFVYLAVPSLNLGRRNMSADPSDAFRYSHASLEFEDENTGGNPQMVPVRALNFQVLVGQQGQTSYELMPIARLEKSAQADAAPQLDVTFVPPLLSCDAWKPLADGVLNALLERLERKIDWLVEQIESQGITFERRATGDALVLKQLQQLNEAVTTMRLLVTTP